MPYGLAVETRRNEGHGGGDSYTSANDPNDEDDEVQTAKCMRTQLQGCGVDV